VFFGVVRFGLKRERERASAALLRVICRTLFGSSECALGAVQPLRVLGSRIADGTIMRKELFVFLFCWGLLVYWVLFSSSAVISSMGFGGGVVAIV
jgi:hypothetical protein